MSNVEFAEKSWSASKVSLDSNLDTESEIVVDFPRFLFHEGATRFISEECWIGESSDSPDSDAVDAEKERDRSR